MPAERIQQTWLPRETFLMANGIECKILGIGNVPEKQELESDPEVTEDWGGVGCGMGEYTSESAELCASL